MTEVTPTDNAAVETAAPGAKVSNMASFQNEVIGPLILPGDPKQAEAATSAAPAQGPTKTGKKSFLDPGKFRKAKAPVTDEENTEGMQTVIKVVKPGQRNFFMAHSDEEYRLWDVPMVANDGGDWFLIAPELELGEELERFVSRVNLVTCINLRGVVFIWPFKNTQNDWSKSASRVVRLATEKWVRIRADFQAGGYRTEFLSASLGAVRPKWPTASFEELFNLAFEGKQIDSLDHPVLKALQGFGQ